MKSEAIQFGQLPGQNPLFLAFLDSSDRVRQFFNPLPSSKPDWEERVRTVLGRPHFDRGRLVSVLTSTNRTCEAGPATGRNLQLLAQPETVVVVTGQQVGLLGGPGYAVYKAVTALRLVRRLRAFGISAVPVFWLAADDSDFDEIRKGTLISRNGEIVGVEHPDLRVHSQQMAGTVSLAAHDVWIDPVRASLPDSFAYEGLLEDYRPGRSFREAFGRWVQRLFQDDGLILFDPLEPGFRQESAEFFEVAVRRREELVAASLARKQELAAAGFTPQVKVDGTETFLFLVEGSERFKLEYIDGAYRAKGKSRLRLTPDELSAGIADGSVLVGPNVLLRPLMQDFLFPTVVGVVGPSEVAYTSQVTAISRFWGQEPVVWPRVGFTIVDRKSRRLLRRHNLEAFDVIRYGPDQLMARILETDGEGHALQAVEALREGLERQSDQLRRCLQEEDETVARLLDTALRKIRYQVDKVKGRYLLNKGYRNDYRRRHFDYLSNVLFPEGHLQERTLNFVSLLDRAGPSLVPELIEEADPDCRAHRLFYV